MVIEICVGSSCYVKGSNEMISIIKELLKENGWQEQVTLKGAFCMQVCQNNGIGLKINGEFVRDVGIHNAKEFFFNRIKQEVEGE
ncbi:MAG: (2Fe-2S) ferredoxin domain-containing protein [Erysipelotrichaceae bacterium]